MALERIKKGDEVIVIAGKDRGRHGTVLRVYADERVLVENVNIVKKHQMRASRAASSRRRCRYMPRM